MSNEIYRKVIKIEDIFLEMFPSFFISPVCSKIIVLNLFIGYAWAVLQVGDC